MRTELAGIDTEQKSNQSALSPRCRQVISRLQTPEVASETPRHTIQDIETGALLLRRSDPGSNDGSVDHQAASTSGREHDGSEADLSSVLVHAERTASDPCNPEAGAPSAEAGSEIQADCCEVRWYATVPR